MDIGNILKKSRINAGISVKQISNKLIKQGYKASEKTVYSWENGNSHPTPEILLTLCDIYGIKDILKTFGYNGYKKDGSLQLNMNEIKLIEKYRLLDDFDKETINIIIERILNKIENTKEQESSFNKSENLSVYDEAPDTPEELERLCPPVDINKFNSRTG